MKVAKEGYDCSERARLGREGESAERYGNIGDVACSEGKPDNRFAFARQ
jgi:hypothetical protein